MKQLFIGLVIGLSASAAFAQPKTDKDFIWQAIEELKGKVAEVHHDQQRLELKVNRLKRWLEGGD